METTPEHGHGIEMSASSHWRGRGVFVTGGSGLLGGWLVTHLLARGARVVCLVHKRGLGSVVQASGLAEEATLVWGRVTDLELIKAALVEHGIETVFHAAAQAIVGTANRDPITTFDTNIAGTWTVLEACRLVPSVHEIVVTSSDKAYGEQVNLPYREEMAVEGGRPYETSKACADLIARSYAVAFGLPVAVTRCGNFFGAGDLNWNRLVPGTIRSLAEGRRPVIRSDGQAVRDYLYVEDGALAHLHLASRLAEDRTLIGEAFNFSHEVRVTVLEMVEKLAKLMGSSLVPEVRNEATDEIRVQYLSSAKARMRLGWRPRFTLDEGLERTVIWYREKALEMVAGER